MEHLFFIIYVMLEVFLGSVFFCPLVCKIFKGIDLTAVSDDHNPGAFNAFEHAGIRIGMLGLLLDILKGFLPVLCFRLLSENYFLSATGRDYTRTFWMALVLIAPVLGHALGIFTHFRGGKCIATSFGVLLGVVPLSYSFFILAMIYIASCFFKKESNRSKSIATYSIFSLVSFLLVLLPKMTSQRWIHVGCVLIGIIAIIKHLINKEDVHEKSGKEDEAAHHAKIS